MINAIFDIISKMHSGELMVDIRENMLSLKLFYRYRPALTTMVQEIKQVKILILLSVMFLFYQ